MNTGPVFMMLIQPCWTFSCHKFSFTWSNNTSLCKYYYTLLKTSNDPFIIWPKSSMKIPWGNIKLTVNQVQGIYRHFLFFWKYTYSFLWKYSLKLEHNPLFNSHRALPTPHRPQTCAFLMSQTLNFPIFFRSLRSRLSL